MQLLFFSVFEQNSEKISGGGGCSFFEKKEPKKLSNGVYIKRKKINPVESVFVFAKIRVYVGEATCLPQIGVQNCEIDLCFCKNMGKCRDRRPRRSAEQRTDSRN